MIDIRHIVASETMPAVAALMREHWLETEEHITPDGPAPVVEAYKAMEASKAIEAFGAYDDGNLVGYVTLFVGPHHHYGFTYALHDALFVTESARDRGAGLMLMRAAEKAARERGARFFTWHAKPGSVFAQLLLRRGYVNEENIYRKDL